ncbi:NAD(P)-binding domain containing protein [Parasponia andersonii]|uniref:NAD(P)-binding domain containing protein n=1 Tax=Parasponia andersonii TaxID=3476 RepID=A0A2P5B8X8_PARAD|nr:NAD(P)-binding domain containing protein [Parasponia andersonii]
MKRNQNRRVCVTGASGYIGPWLVRKLLENGHTVHATLRNLENASKAGLLKSLPNAEDKLVLFQADIYNAIEFDAAIKGCDFVFHVATPMLHDTQNSQYKDTAEAAVAGARLIAESCIRSGTVKRLIYTASIMASSQLTEDGVGLRSYVDESCWTPLDHSFTHGTDFTLGYTRSKTLAEKAVLSYSEKYNGELEVVTLCCGLVGGETLLPYLPLTVEVIFSQLRGNLYWYNSLKLSEEITGSVPLVHIEDVCNARLFCMERPSMRGRFFCAASNPSVKGIGLFFQEYYPEYKIAKERVSYVKRWNLFLSVY